MATQGCKGSTDRSLIYLTITISCGVKCHFGVLCAWIGSGHPRLRWCATHNLAPTCMQLCNPATKRPSMGFSNVVEACVQALPQYSQCAVSFDSLEAVSAFGAKMRLVTLLYRTGTAPTSRRECDFLLYCCAWVVLSRFCGGGCFWGA